MLGQILILHNLQNSSSLSTSSQLSNKKRLIALIGSVNENVAHFSVHVHVSLISNLTNFIYTRISEQPERLISSRTYIVLSKLQGFQDHFQTCKANPEKGRGGEIDVVNIRILPLWHSEVRKQFFGEVSKHCNYFWLSGLTGCSLNIQEFTILTFTITT